MKKLIGVLIMTTALSGVAFGAPKKKEETPLTDEQVVQRFIGCTALMQFNAEKLKDSPDLQATVKASAERYHNAAEYFLRGRMDVDDINTYIMGGIGAARAAIEGEYAESGGAAVEKRLGECNAPQMMTKGFEAFQASNATQSTAPVAPVASVPLPGTVAPGDLPVNVAVTAPAAPVAAPAATTTTTTTVTTTTAVPAAAPAPAAEPVKRPRTGTPVPMSAPTYGQRSKGAQ